MALTIFEAKKEGICAICGKQVLGKRVLYNNNKQLVHADCQFPDKVKSKVMEGIEHMAMMKEAVASVALDKNPDGGGQTQTFTPESKSEVPCNYLSFLSPLRFPIG